jgi:hypothetical protein
LQQSSQEYEQLLQLSAEQIESLKLELAERMQQASAQELEAAQRSLQLRDEYEPAIAAELKRLEELGQQLQKQQQLLEQERAEVQAQRSGSRGEGVGRRAGCGPSGQSEEIQVIDPSVVCSSAGMCLIIGQVL